MDGGDAMDGGMTDGDMMAGMDDDCPVDAGSVSGQALSSTELELSWDAGDGVGELRRVSWTAVSCRKPPCRA